MVKMGGKSLNLGVSILEDKIAIAKRILEKEDSSLLEQVKELFEVRVIDFWDELPEAVKEGIKTAQKEANEGLLTPHEEVMKKYQKYLLVCRFFGISRRK